MTQLSSLKGRMLAPWLAMPAIISRYVGAALLATVGTVVVGHSHFIVFRPAPQQSSETPANNTSVPFILKEKQLQLPPTDDGTTSSVVSKNYMFDYFFVNTEYNTKTTYSFKANSLEKFGWKRDGRKTCSDDVESCREEWISPQGGLYEFLFAQHDDYISSIGVLCKSNCSDSSEGMSEVFLPMKSVPPVVMNKTGAE